MRVTTKTTYKLTQREVKEAIQDWMRREWSVNCDMTVEISTTRGNGWSDPRAYFKVNVARTHEMDSRPRNRR